MSFENRLLKIKKNIKRELSSVVTRSVGQAQLSRCKLIMTLLVKNEVDIVRRNIEFHLRHGVLASPRAGLSLRTVPPPETGLARSLLAHQAGCYLKVAVLPWRNTAQNIINSAMPRAGTTSRFRFDQPR